jgi:general secretion pathway protein G
MPPSHKHPAKAAFTLIELLVVMAIIAILMALTLGIAGAVNRGAAEAKARAQIADLTLEIEKHKADKGSYPTDLRALVTWYETEKYKGTKYLTTDIIAGNPVDPWGKSFYYSVVNEFVFRLGSLGPDGQFASSGLRDKDGKVLTDSPSNFGQGDDITNQK